MVLILKKYFQEVSIHIKRIIQRGERDMNMSDLIGREVKIGDKEGEITNVLGIGYEVTFSMLLMAEYLLMQEIFMIILFNESRISQEDKY